MNITPEKSALVNIDCAEIELLNSGIISIRYKSDYEVGLKDVKEVEQVFISMSKGGAIYCLMDTLGRYNNFTEEAQKFLSKEASIVKDRKLKCSAVIIDNLPYRILIRLFTKFLRPPFKIKAFGSKDAATVWLLKEMQ